MARWRVPRSPSRRFYALLLTLLLLGGVGLGLASPARAAADWNRLGLAGQRVSALAVSPFSSQVLFAGTPDQGVLRSTDGGSSWIPVNNGLGNRSVNTIFPDAGNASVVLLGAGERAGAAGAGLYKSTDTGASWTRHLDAKVNRVLQSPADRLTLYAIGTPTFARSTNGGLDWTPVTSTVLAGVELRGLAVHPQQPQTLLAGGVTPAGSGRLVRSTDGGATWQVLADVGLPAINDVAYAAADGSIVLLGTAAGLWRSVDGGQSWQRVLGASASAAIQDLLVSPDQPSTVFAASLGTGVLVSTDGGATWAAQQGVLAGANVYTLALDRAHPRSLYAGTDDGVWRLPLGDSASPGAVDARIEIVWPHGGKPVTEATRVNVTAYLFQPGTLNPVACLYDRPVRLWRSLNNAPAELVATGIRRLVSDNGRRFPAWDFNDIPVDQAMNPRNKYSFRVTVDGITTRSNIWVHGADARTIFPQQDVPTGIGPAGAAVDTRIEIVWPHDAQGRPATVQTAPLANLVVDVYNHTTMQSVPSDWSKPVRLYRATNADVETPIAVGKPIVVTRGGVTYPRWAFDDVDVSAARDPATKLSFRAEVEGVPTFSNVWIHGVDARTIFPTKDVPTANCE